MCLAVPGKVLSVSQQGDDPVIGRIGTIDFQGNRLEVSLGFVPEAVEGTWVLVHAGCAIAVVDEADARETWTYLAEAGMGEMPGEFADAAGEAKR